MEGKRIPGINWITKTKYMRLWFFFLLNLAITILGYGQKKDLDTAAFYHWPMTSGGGLSPDGEYAYYLILVNRGHTQEQSTLVLKSVHADWSVTIPQAHVMGFTRDSRKTAVLRLPHDSIALLRLGTDIVEYLTGIKDLYLQKDWIIYRRKNNDSLHIRNLENCKALDLSTVEDIIPGKRRDALVIQRQTDSNTYNLFWIDLTDYSGHTFYSGARTNQWEWDPEEKQLAFAGGETGRKSVYLYKPGSAMARCILADSTGRLDADCHIASISRFTANGKYLLFKIAKDTTPSTAQPPSIVDIYKYTDLEISFDKGSKERPEVAYLRSVDPESGEIRVIEEEGDQAAEDNGNFIMNGNFILVAHEKKGYEWEKYLPGSTSYHLIRFRDGQRIDMPGENGFWFSPSNKWLLFFDAKISAFRSLNLESLAFSSRSYPCTGDHWTYVTDGTTKIEYPMGVASWVDSGNAVLVYSRHGLWQLDLTGRASPKIFTNGITKDHDMVYKVVVTMPNQKDGDSIILSGFNTYTKEQGFYRS